MKKSLIYLFIFPISSSVVYAKNALKCEYDEFYKTGCSIENIRLSENDSFQMDYLVKYKFICEGHDFTVGIETETGFYPFKRGEVEQSVIATGQAHVTLKALDPGKLYYKILQKNCSIDVLGTNKRPSVLTLTQWNQQAKTEVSLLYAMLDNYQLAKNLENIDNWNLEKLSLLKSNLKKLVNLFPNNLHFKMLLHTVESALENRPPKIILPDGSKEELTSYYRNKLEAEMKNAEGMLRLFEQWKATIDADLAQAIENIRNQI